MSDFSWAVSMKAQLSKELSHAENVKALRQHDGRPIQAIPFVATNRAHYNGEVGKKEKDIIFHLFPRGDVFPSSETTHTPFEDVMGDAFIEVFRFEDKIEAAFTKELNSWAIRVIGFSDNPAIDVLCNRLFEALDRRIKL
jgi:hypothetical protein